MAQNAYERCRYFRAESATPRPTQAAGIQLEPWGERLSGPEVLLRSDGNAVAFGRSVEGQCNLPVEDVPEAVLGGWALLLPGFSLTSVLFQAKGSRLQPFAGENRKASSVGQREGTR